MLAPARRKRCVARSKRLRGESRGPHAQKAERPENERKDERANCDRSDINRIGIAPDDGRVHDADERRRDVRDHDWHGNGKDSAVGQM